MKYHKDLTSSRWNKFSLMEQMANIGSEVFRAISWRTKDHKLSQLSFERALELFDLTGTKGDRSHKRGQVSNKQDITLLLWL